MAKRSHKNQIDVVTEAQQNARWFGGRRRYTFWNDMTPSEWSRYQRNYPLIRKLVPFLILPMGIVLAIASIQAIRADGITPSSVVTEIITVFVWMVIILSIWRFLKKGK